MTEANAWGAVIIGLSGLGGYICGWNARYLMVEWAYRQQTNKPKTALWVRYILVLGGMILVAAAIGQVWTITTTSEVVGYIAAVFVLLAFWLGYVLAKRRANAKGER